MLRNDDNGLFIRVTCDNPDCNNSLKEKYKSHSEAIKGIENNNWFLSYGFVLCPKCQKLKYIKCTFSQFVKDNSSRYSYNPEKYICGKNPEIECRGSKRERDNCPEWRLK